MDTCSDCQSFSNHDMTDIMLANYHTNRLEIHDTEYCGQDIRFAWTQLSPWGLFFYVRSIPKKILVS